MTAVAVPVPAPLELLAVTVKPIGLPALTVGASAVFANDKPGHCTVVDALFCTSGLLVADAVAVFAYVPQLAVVVPLLTCTEALAPGARSPNEQPNV